MEQITEKDGVATFEKFYWDKEANGQKVVVESESFTLPEINTAILRLEKGMAELEARLTEFNSIKAKLETG